MSQDAVEQLLQRGARLTENGDVDGALQCYQRATELDPENAEAWWRYALASKDDDNVRQAFGALLKLIELAPQFAPGWAELACIHDDMGDHEQAIEAFECALLADADYVHALRMLQLMLKRLDAEEAEPQHASRRIELLKKLDELSALDSSELFDLGYLLAESDDDWAAIAAYERYTRYFGGVSAFYNLGLAYYRVGRMADAVDSLAVSIARGKKEDSALRSHQRVRNELAKLRQQALAKPSQLLGASEWFSHYLNPFSLLNGDPDELLFNPKSLQKAKQSVLREIELEDGKIHWLNGLVLDKSAALAKLDELNDAEAFAAHRTVFENKPLLEFLHRGDLDHFLLAQEVPDELTLPHMLDESVFRVIGPSFAAQFDKVLASAVENGNTLAVQCLMGGRRWVSAEQSELCFEGAKRSLKRLVEPLTELMEQCDRRAIRRNEVVTTLGTGNLGAMLSHLPIEFHELHEAVFRALRELSVALFNRERNADEAMSLLQLGKPFAAKSSALAHQYATDEKTLKDIIAEEKGQEAHLRYAGKDLSVTKAGVSWGTERIAEEDVVGLRWGLVQLAGRSNTYRFTVAYQNARGPDIAVSWTAEETPEQRKHFEDLVASTVRFILPGVVKRFSQSLDDGQQIRVGTVSAVKEGVVFSVSGWFSTKSVLAPWDEIDVSLSNGELTLSYRANRKACASLPVESTYNAPVLHYLLKTKGKVTE